MTQNVLESKLRHMVGKVTLPIQPYRNQENGLKRAGASKTLQGIIAMTGGLPKVIGFVGAKQIEKRMVILYLAGVKFMRIRGHNLGTSERTRISSNTSRPSSTEGTRWRMRTGRGSPQLPQLLLDLFLLAEMGRAGLGIASFWAEIFLNNK